MFFIVPFKTILKGAFNIKHLTNTGIPIIKIRRSEDRLIFVMEITVPGKTVFVLKRGHLYASVNCAIAGSCNGLALNRQQYQT